MLKFVLKEEKKKIKTEYVLRFFIVFLNIVIFCSLAFVLMVYPSYFLLNNQINLADEQIGLYEKTTVSLDKQELKELSKKLLNDLKILNQDTVKTSYAVQRILSILPEGVFINNISVSVLENTNYSVSFSGTANKRVNITELNESIKNQKDFLNISFPYANLAKIENIPFNVTVEIKNEKQ